jgi:alanine or glycine:cation symporter, AGCS family
MFEIINNFLWGKALVGILILAGIWFTIISKAVQFRFFGRMSALLKQGRKHQTGQISSLQAVAVTIAGRVGAGNIAGVAVAITLGGPGAIFWMWLIGLIGMATSFFECSLAQLFKQVEPDGSYRGGPAYYMQIGLKKRWMGILYSGLLAISVGFALIALQSFTVASSISQTFDIPSIYTGVLLAVITAVVIFGGIRRIAEVAEWVVPIMAVGYLALGLVVIGLNLEKVPSVLMLIIKSAFGLEQAVGGGMGAALLMGVQRGLFSNEAGLGHAANVAAIADVKHPAVQGIVQSLSVFIDTIVLCTVTALIILLSDVYSQVGDIDGVVLTQVALAEHIGDWSGIFVTFALSLFAFSTMLYLYYLGENGLNYFSKGNKTVFFTFRLIILCQIIWGALLELKTVFAVADLAVGVLALGNLIALGFLWPIGLRVLLDYQIQLSRGIAQPNFNHENFPDLDIDERAWPTSKK